MKRPINAISEHALPMTSDKWLGTITAHEKLDRDLGY